MSQLMSTKEVAEFMCCSEKHISRLRERGLKSIRLGHLIRYRPEDVEEFLNLCEGADVSA